MAIERKRAIPNDPHPAVAQSTRDTFRSWGLYDERMERSPKILISTGFGYRNVGDEAHLSACMSRWLRDYPSAAPYLAQPQIALHRAALHGHRVEWAPRVAWLAPKLDL